MAEDEGIPIYVISTAEVNKDPISSNVFKRISQRTGGKAYWAKTWQKQVEAFEDIREDLGNSYTVTYYPKANPNEGFRKITIERDQRPRQEVAHPQPPGLSAQPRPVASTVGQVVNLRPIGNRPAELARPLEKTLTILLSPAY